MRIKLFTLLSLLLLVASCTSNHDVDYSGCTEIKVINDSSFEIAIFYLMPIEEGFPERVSIASNAIFEQAECALGVTPSLPYFHRMLICFGDDVYTLHQLSDGDAYHNFCVENSYEVKQTDKRHRRYTFTFTDEDYEYALANPAPDDVIEEVVGVE